MKTGFIGKTRNGWLLESVERCKKSEGPGYLGLYRCVFVKVESSACPSCGELMPNSPICCGTMHLCWSPLGAQINNLLPLADLQDWAD